MNSKVLDHPVDISSSLDQSESLSTHSTSIPCPTLVTNESISNASHESSTSLTDSRAQSVYETLTGLLDQFVAVVAAFRLPLGLIHLMAMSEHLRFAAGVLLFSLLSALLGTFPVAVATLLVTLIFWLQSNQRERRFEHQQFAETLAQIQLVQNSAAASSAFSSSSASSSSSSIPSIPMPASTASSYSSSVPLDHDALAVGEPALWLNRIVEKLWVATVPDLVSTYFQTTLQPLLDQVRPKSLSHLQIGDFHLGPVPPLLSCLRLVPGQPPRHLQLECQLHLASDQLWFRLHCTFKSLPLTLQIDSLQLHAHLRLTLALADQPLLLPHLLSLSCLRMPLLNFALNELSLTRLIDGFDVSALPGLRSSLRHLLAARLRDALLWPAALSFPLAGPSPPLSLPQLRQRLEDALPFIADLAVVFPQDPTPHPLPPDYLPLLRSASAAHLASLSPAPDRPCFLFYKRTASSLEALTHLAFLHAPPATELPLHWHVVRRAPSGASANLFASRPAALPQPLFLAFRRGGLSDPITSLALLFGEDKLDDASRPEAPLPGHTLVPVDLMPTADDRFTYCYLSFARKRPANALSAAPQPIVDLQFVSGYREVPSDGFELLSLAHPSGKSGQQAPANLNYARPDHQRLFLSYSRTTFGTVLPIVEVRIARADREGSFPPGFTPVRSSTDQLLPFRLASARSVEEHYLIYRRATTPPAATDHVLYDVGLLIRDRSRSSKLPQGFALLPTDLNPDGDFAIFLTTRFAPLNAAAPAPPVYSPHQIARLPPHYASAGKTTEAPISSPTAPVPLPTDASSTATDPATPPTLPPQSAVPSTSSPSTPVATSSSLPLSSKQLSSKQLSSKQLSSKQLSSQMPTATHLSSTNLSTSNPSTLKSPHTLRPSSLSTATKPSAPASTQSTAGSFLSSGKSKTKSFFQRKFASDRNTKHELDRLTQLGCSPQNQEFVQCLCENRDHWLHFPIDPLPPGKEFTLSQFQIDHVREMLKLVPSLEALRYELVPSKMSETNFWAIYFESMNANLRKLGISIDDPDDEFINLGDSF